MGYFSTVPCCPERFRDALRSFFVFVSHEDLTIICIALFFTLKIIKITAYRTQAGRGGVRGGQKGFGLHLLTRHRPSRPQARKFAIVEQDLRYQHQDRGLRFGKVCAGRGFVDDNVRHPWVYRSGDTAKGEVRHEERHVEHGRDLVHTARRVPPILQPEYEKNF
jgi:hypothetical protein